MKTNVTKTIARDIRDSLYEISTLLKKELTPQEFERFEELHDQLLSLFDDLEI